MIHDEDAGTDNQNVSLVLANGMFVDYTVTAVCQLDTVALGVDFGPQAFSSDQVPILYRFDDEPFQTENWSWDSENQVLLKFDKKIAKRLRQAEKLSIRFAELVEVFEFSHAADKVEEFSDACG